MAHTIFYDPELHIITTTFLGPIDLNYAKEITTEFALMAREKNCGLFINDIREATIKLSILELYKAPKMIADIFTSVGFPIYQIKRAVVVAQRSDAMRFFENVAFNRGHRNKLFQDIDEAKKWLLEK